MNVKVVKGKERVVLYECNAAKGEKEGPETVITPVRIEQGSVMIVAQIVLPRDGDIVYVENSSGRTIDTFRAGEDLPTGRPFEIQDGDGQGQAEQEQDRARVFRNLPRGSAPEDLDVRREQRIEEASRHVVRPPARG